MSFINEGTIPFYIPKLKDGKVAEHGLPLDYINIDLNHIKWRSGILAPLREAASKLMVDPVTHKSFFADSKAQPAMVKIGYPDLEPEALYSEKNNRDTLIELSIQEQIKAGADTLIAPYLHTPDTDDTKFSVNLTLLSETLVYLKNQQIELPVFAKLCVSSQILTRQPVINNIFSRYCEDYEGRIEGIILCVTDFEGHKADINHMLGYANIVHQAQSVMRVIVSPINSYGEILVALGASGICSGLHGSESVSIKQLQEGGTGGGKNIHERIYIPEVMTYLNFEEARKIGYTSESDGCVIDFTSSDPNAETKSRHYLNDKLATMIAMRGMNRDEKIVYMTSKVTNARNLLYSYVQEFEVYQRDIPHDRWLQVLTQAKAWSDPQKDNEELEALLAEIEKENA